MLRLFVLLVGIVGVTLAATWVSDSNSTVCSGKGSCIGTDVCSCDTNYFGFNCQTTSCFNISSASSSVCSGNGTCTAYNTCTCNIGAVGADCSIPACGGIAFNDSRVCSGHGYCQAGTVIKKVGPGGSPRTVVTNYNTQNTFFNSSISSINGVNGINLNGFWITNRYGLSSPTTGLTPTTYTIAPGEYLTQVIIYYYTGYDIITGMAFTTSTGGSGIFGNNRGSNQFVYNFGLFEYIVGFFGQYGYATGGAYDTPGMTLIGFYTQTPGTGCVCRDGYVGINCDVVSCYDKYNYDPSVCSGVGKCIFNNNCSCPVGYYGEQCQDWTCDGIHRSHANVCNSKGTCVSPNNCVYWTCNGIDARNESVCSGFGYCTSTGQCSCFDGYSDNNCSTFYCSKVINTSPLVCSGTGDCISSNNCKCKNGYSGVVCADYSCGNISRYNVSVCSSVGQCIAPNNCSCDSFATGMNCEIYNCQGLLYSHPNVCNRQGSCVITKSIIKRPAFGANRTDVLVFDDYQPDSVVSAFGFYGNSIINAVQFNRGLTNYQSPVYFYPGEEATQRFKQLLPREIWTILIIWSDLVNNIAAVGVSTSLNNGYLIGTPAATALTYPIPQNQRLLGFYGQWASTAPIGISKLGFYIASYSPPTCICRNNYYGDNCTFVDCNGLQNTNPNVCSRNGICSAYNNCTCNYGSYGNNCQFTTCYGISNFNSSVCSGNGSCTSYNTCVCSYGFSGPDCSKFYCSGVEARNASVCNSHGTCVSPNVCNCYNSSYGGVDCGVFSCYGVMNNASTACGGTTVGKCIDFNTCLCSSGYSGDACNIISSKAVISLISSAYNSANITSSQLYNMTLLLKNVTNSFTDDLSTKIQVLNIISNITATNQLFDYGVASNLCASVSNIISTTTATPNTTLSSVDVQLAAYSTINSIVKYIADTSNQNTVTIITPELKIVVSQSSPASMIGGTNSQRRYIDRAPIYLHEFFY
ncbi:tenascin [Acrasis kona]|uniref:Tenascin n=1 Tax=Acrasis kona TaxID=1008807 RepID=A0AAW2YRK5_9EUKA